jgi:hypothetical protein
VVKAPSPIDVETGIPLPLCPRPHQPLPVGRGVANVSREGDWHHPFYYKRTLLGHGLAGQALRSSRVQWMAYDDHHEDRQGLHAFYDGPPLPQTDQDWFKTTVLVCADYVPIRGVDFHRSGEPYIRTMRTGERQLLLNSGVIRVAKYDDIKPYLLEYVAQNGVENMDERTIDEFLHTRSMKKKRRLGEALIRAASEVVAEPLDDQYRNAKKQRLLPYQRTRRAANFIGNLITYKAEPGLERDVDTILALESYLQAA